MTNRAGAQTETQPRKGTKLDKTQQFNLSVRSWLGLLKLTTKQREF